MRLRAPAAALLAALLLGACGDDDDDAGEESVRDFTIQEVVERPPLPGEDVGLVGEATPVGDLGFILSDDDDAIFVLGGADEVEERERVPVVGEVDRIDQELSNELADALAGEDPEPEARSVPEARVRTSAGAPFIDLERLGRGPPGEGEQ